MRKLGLLTMVLGLSASVASAANLNMRVESGNPLSGSVQVQPGEVVQYTVTGVLSDMLNEGLALVGFDLEFDGGPLTQADTPVSLPMSNFVIPDGITNPAGYGGTVISGKLVQCGGGQNTIKNPGGPGFADFPVGTVVTHVAHGDTVILTGSLTAPAAPGTYHLNLTNLFANVIKQGETGAVFWATEQAGAGAISNLTITVSDVVACNIAGSVPASGSIDARQPHDLNDANIVFGWDFVDLDVPSACASVLLAADFTLTKAGGDGGISLPTISSVVQQDVDTVRLTFSKPIEPGAWTIVTHDDTGTKVCLGYLPGDVNASRGSTAADINALINSLNNVPGFVRPLFATDANRSGAANASDILRVIDLLNGAAAFDPWLNKTLPVNPCN